MSEAAATSGVEEEQKEREASMNHIKTMLHTLSALDELKVISVQECEFCVNSETELPKANSVVPLQVSKKVKFRVKSKEPVARIEP